MLIQLQSNEPEFGVAAPVDRALIDFVEAHGADGYRLYLESLRWPGGAECPRCTSTELLWIATRSKHQCRNCRYQFRVTAGTLFHDSHLPPAKWFLAISLMLASERGLPATRLQEILGGSYKTAWYLEHRIRAAMSGQTGELGPLVAFVHTGPAGVAPAQDGNASAEQPPAAIEAPPSWPLLKRLVAGHHRNLSPKYLTAYWNELRWRATHHSNPNVFRDTVVALLGHSPAPYDLLTAPRSTASSQQTSQK